MISDKTKLLCLIAVALTVSGCGGSGGSGSENGSVEVIDPQVILEDEVNTVGTTTNESVDVNETSGGFATPVASVSSMEMDAFIQNPLVAAIPSELSSSSSNAQSSGFITNPLLMD